jgi:hypothetical protein
VLFAEGCGLVKAQVNQMGNQYIANQVPRLCKSTPGITDPTYCENVVKADLVSAISITADNVEKECTQCLMNMTKPLFEQYHNNVGWIMGNYSHIAHEVNATLLTKCNLGNFSVAANLSAAWRQPLIDAFKQTTNSTAAFEQALAQNGLTRLYREHENALARKRHSLITNVVAGSGLFIFTGVMMVAGWRRYNLRDKSQRLTPDMRFSRELMPDQDDLLPVTDAVLRRFSRELMPEQAGLLPDNDPVLTESRIV